MPEQLTIVAHLHLKKENFEEAKAFLLGLVEESRKDPACIDYHLHQDRDDPLEFCFYENWKERASWDMHMKTPALLELARRREDFFSRPTELHLMSMISRRND